MKKKKYQKIVKNIQDYTKRFETVHRTRDLVWKDELYSNGLVSCVSKRTRKRTQAWVDADGAEKNVLIFAKRNPFVVKITKYSANNEGSCYDEYQNYVKIKNAGFGDFCPEMVMIDKKICIQEKVNTRYGKSSKKEISKGLFKYVYHKHYLKLDDEFNYKYPNCNSVSLPTGWLENAIRYHGAKRVVKFLNFIIGELEINDLHSGNVGYVGERPVIFDMSGYYGDRYSY